ncbi:putative GTPase IMAP family member 1 [Hibiscus syriacus]|uniref:GTPase IMAP family member 1 n=1 Tax=Hibiscus syriacus TaxID=106335 RepID=A0A6A3A6E6_HIBSY|nr:uncharacterized protein LOC120132546 [Hibiscus syriacus]KAE8699930.1 putative GTPase IMAP family member 1 [Hibiscus syriacus]
MASANPPSSPPPPPPSSPPPPSPPLPSSPTLIPWHYESSPAVPSDLVPPQTLPDTAFNENGTFNVDEKKPQIVDYFAILDDPEHNEKYQKYEADYTRRLLAKYFSKKNFYGGNIFDDKTTIDNETILSSRWPCTRSFADPVHASEDSGNGGSVSEPQTLTNMSNGKLSLKKNG